MRGRTRRRWPRQQAPAEDKEDDKLQPYFSLPREAKAVVLYNSRAPSARYRGAPTSNGYSFAAQGKEVLGDASDPNPRMIDISEPGWIRKLDELVKTKGKFDHVFVFDHGNYGSVSFGKHPQAYPPSPEFIGLDKDSIGARVIASVLADNGALHLGSCLTGGKDEQGRDVGLQYLQRLHKAMDRGNHISVDAITGVMYNRVNQFTGEIIRVPPLPPPTPQPPHEKR